jgi:phosphotransferase system HPr (HPr) family protein
MTTKKIIVKNDHGIHARVARKGVEKALISSSQVTISKGSKKARGTSIIELLMLEATQGSEINLEVTGGDEEKNLHELAALFNDGAGI